MPPTSPIAEPAVQQFRGLAILAIVAVHAVAGWPFFLGPEVARSGPLPLISRVSEVLLHDSTIYFALISGLLYAHLLHRRGWRAFARSKALNVALPYAVMTLIFTALDWTPQQGWSIGVPNGQPYGPTLLMNLLTGQALFVFWYLPVLMLLFALTPLLYRLATGASRPARVGLGLVLALPLVCSRTGIELSFSSVVYFAGAYTAGLWLGADLPARCAQLARWRGPLLAAVAVCTVLLFLLVSPDSDAEPPAWLSPTEALFYVQKLAAGLVLLVSLRATGRPGPRWLDALASRAFAVYFLHLPVMLTVAPPLLASALSRSGWPGHVSGMALLFVTGLVGSLLLTVALQALLGRRSRWLVGA